MKRLPKEMQGHCDIQVRVIDLKTGEQRQLSQEEIAERMQKILSIPPDERIRQSLQGAQRD